MLPLGNAEPGPWRSSRTPYMTPIARAFVDPAFKTVVGVIAAQMGKSETVMNVIGERLDEDPTPILYIAPTQKLAESVSNDRAMKMFRSVASLWDKLGKGKQNKVTEKWVGGIRLGFGWAGSATELSSHPAGLVIVDERDRVEDIKGEGDPVEMARARHATYADGKVGVVSTPTEGNVQTYEHPETKLEHWGDLEVADETAYCSPIWKLWQEGTRHEWAWPCPSCSAYFIPRLKHLIWPDGASPARAKREAKLVCPACGTLIGEESKTAMNQLGVYLAPGQGVVQGNVVGEVQPNETVSFWVSGLCSPWKSFGDRARALVAAQRSGSPARVRGVINLAFGELYRVGGEGADWKDVSELREGYSSGAVPDGAQVLTCGVDVQKNRLIFGVRGWGWNSESWLVEAGELWGATKHDAVWGELERVLARDYGGKRIRLMLVDSGYNPSEEDRSPDNQIYSFCRRNRRAAPTKGHDGQDKPFRAAKIDVSHRGKVYKNGLDLWHLDSDYFKSWVHARIEWPAGEPGGWHLPVDATTDYCKQIVAEFRTLTASGRATWVRIRRENHFLDVEALNSAAAHILRLHALPKLVGKTQTVADQATPGAEQPQTVAARRVAQQPPRRPGFITGWRR